jgi:hypothetical protein
VLRLFAKSELSLLFKHRVEPGIIAGAPRRRHWTSERAGRHEPLRLTRRSAREPISKASARMVFWSAGVREGLSIFDASRSSWRSATRLSTTSKLVGLTLCQNASNELGSFPLASSSSHNGVIIWGPASDFAPLDLLRAVHVGFRDGVDAPFSRRSRR